MRNNKIISKIIIILLILFFCLLCILCFLFIYLQKNNPNTSEVQNEKEITIEDIIEKHDSEFIKKENNKIYVNFSKNLFEDNGDDNKSFFESLINDLKPLLDENTYLIDEEKNINFFIQYDYEKENYIIILNDNKNIDEFYEDTDGKAYIKVDDSEIVNGTLMSINDEYLLDIYTNNGYFSSIKGKIGEGKDLGNGYTSYLDGTVKIRLVPTGGVKNIIFTKDYKGDLLDNIKPGMSLNEILEKNPDISFGGLEKNYLGYRDLFYYTFFYKDEVSLYTYSYQENTKFEQYLEEYLNSRDLDKFVTSLENNWCAYDSFEYNSDIQKAHIFYSTRGVDINIQDNDPSGITFYQNYCFTDYTKSLVKDGIVKFKPNTDSVEQIELERRKNN